MKTKAALQVLGIVIILVLLFIEGYLPRIGSIIAVACADLIGIGLILLHTGNTQVKPDSMPEYMEISMPKDPQTIQFYETAEKYRAPIIIGLCLILGYFFFAQIPGLAHILLIVVVGGYLVIARMLKDA